MYLFKRNLVIKTICSRFRCYSQGRKTHYEVLNLSKNCTDKDIKEAFIKMSKKYHPDKNKDAQAQEQFIRIVEAYDVLGKPSSRAAYDNMRQIYYTSSTYEYKPHVPYNLRRDRQEYYDYNHETQKQKESSDSDAYYGVAGVKKLPNSSIIIICVAVAAVGAIIQFYVIKQAYLGRQKYYNERTRKLSQELNELREAARDNTNEMQTQLLLEKIVSAANSSATATLGQALASEEK